MERNEKVCILEFFAAGERYMVRFVPGQEEEAAEAIASYAEDERYSLSWQNIEVLLLEVRGEASGVTGS